MMQFIGLFQNFFVQPAMLYDSAQHKLVIAGNRQHIGQYFADFMAAAAVLTISQVAVIQIGPLGHTAVLGRQRGQFGNALTIAEWDHGQGLAVRCKSQQQLGKLFGGADMSAATSSKVVGVTWAA